MGQKYEIFFRRHVFVFAPKEEFEGKADAVRSTLSLEETLGLFERLKKLRRPRTILITKPNAYQEFFGYFKMVEAGGGGVFNTKGRLLLIHRLGNWDLPKGKLNKRELPEMGAIREVEEECNVHKLRIIQELPTTYHIYYQKKWCLKRTHWYAMISEKFDEAKPQLEEDIDRIKWVKPEKLNVEKLDTYASIRTVLHELKRLSANTVDKHLHSESNRELQ